MAVSTAMKERGDIIKGALVNANLFSGAVALAWEKTFNPDTRPQAVSLFSGADVDGVFPCDYPTAVNLKSVTSDVFADVMARLGCKESTIIKKKDDMNAVFKQMGVTHKVSVTKDNRLIFEVSPLTV